MLLFFIFYFLFFIFPMLFFDLVRRRVEEWCMENKNHATSSVAGINARVLNGECDDFDEYCIQLCGLEECTYIVIQKDDCFMACKNKQYQKKGEFIALYTQFKRNGWRIVADIVIAENEVDAVNQVVKIANSHRLILLLCVFVMMSCSSVDMFIAVVAVILPVLSCEITIAILSDVRSELLKSISFTQRMVA